MFLSKKIGIVTAGLFMAALGLFVFKTGGIYEKKEIAGNTSNTTPIFTCRDNPPDPFHAENKLVFGADFSCYMNYYRNLTVARGAPTAIADIKARIINDSYAKEECHQITHAIGRSAGERSSGVAEAFTDGDALCSAGYFHGVMEGLIQQHGTTELSSGFLDSLCAPFRTTKKGVLTVNHFDCAHGLGHGIMYVKNNELFDSLAVCDTLSDKSEQNPCRTGVFMENVITDFKDHTTKYLKPEDPLYPCGAVKEIYKNACYSFQTSYVLKLTKSFEKTFAACRKVPAPHQDTCFQSVGRDAAGMVDGDIVKTKENCSIAANNREAENCVIGAVGAIINHYHSDTEGLAFCASLSGDLQKVCSDKGREYYERAFR